MINGAHVIISSHDADADRAFLRDTLGFDSVDAGGGWLIFRLPPAEVAVHPGEPRDTAAPPHELYLMCDDIEATLEDLRGKGVDVTSPVRDVRWGLLSAFRLPGGSELAIYEPRHPVARREP
jgi:catechol 2,3-dioxygenase-like lactoylglutathione lyase family enzyme